MTDSIGSDPRIRTHLKPCSRRVA